MSIILGIDTSNYTTSCALVRDGAVEKNIRMLLTVNRGERGLRQSDAVFAHTRNLPQVISQIGQVMPDAIGVSVSPRDEEGSYMPCFLAGKGLAESLGSVMGIPVYSFSHQSGHLMAALYSCGRCDLYEKEIIAFHVSGGTTEAVLVREGQITLLGGCEDISCGKLIDRVGVMLGMQFPCGRELEALAKNGRVPRHFGVCVKDLKCSLSGAENMAADLMKKGECAENIAAFTLEFVKRTLVEMTAQVRERYPGLPVLYAGGVMSNQLIRPALAAMGESYFAAPEYSCDNATGVALLAHRAHKGAEHG